MRTVCTTLFLMLTFSAGAADFTFTVPVRFTNLHPDVRSLTVQCTVTRTGGGSTDSANVIGYGRHNLPISRGGYSGSLLVEFNATAGRNPADAQFYTCAVLGNAPGGAVIPLAGEAESNPIYAPPPGVTNVYEVRGSIRR